MCAVSPARRCAAHTLHQAYTAAFTHDQKKLLRNESVVRSLRRSRKSSTHLRVVRIPRSTAECAEPHAMRGYMTATSTMTVSERPLALFMFESKSTLFPSAF